MPVILLNLSKAEASTSLLIIRKVQKYIPNRKVDDGVLKKKSASRQLKKQILLLHKTFVAFNWILQSCITSLLIEKWFWSTDLTVKINCKTVSLFSFLIQKSGCFFGNDCVKKYYVKAIGFANNCLKLLCETIDSC